MKTYGIICEYNPFHNGHLRHIEETRKHGATHIVAVMSGNFVQRGDVAVIDKFARAKSAVRNGADLVIEMPVVYSLSSAESFARAGMALLAGLGCVDGISFGSECGDAEILRNAAAASLIASNSEKVKPLLEEGMPFPLAVRQIIEADKGPEIAGIFDSPNNTLAVEYLKAIKVLKLDMDVFTVKREGAMHDSDEVSGDTASGSLLRRMIEDEEDISAFVPKDTAELIELYRRSENLAYFDNLERPFLYRLRTCGINEIAETPDIGQGLENRIFEVGRLSNSLDEFLDRVDTKRYTLAKMRRILLNLTLGIKNTDLQIQPPYGRILAFNDRGAEILRKYRQSKKNKYTVPFEVAMKALHDIKTPAISRFVDITAKSTGVYGLSMRNITPSSLDFIVKIEKQT